MRIRAIIWALWKTQKKWAGPSPTFRYSDRIFPVHITNQNQSKKPLPKNRCPVRNGGEKDGVASAAMKVIIAIIMAILWLEHFLFWADSYSYLIA